MRIAVCDDNPQELERIKGLLDAYRQDTMSGLVYKTYTDGLSLLEDMREGSFDLLLLDVMMPLINGMQVAHEIREFDDQVKIVFLTTSPEFAVESYAVGAFFYLLKPASRETLFPVLDKLVRASHNSQEGLMVKFRSGISKILFSRLACVEVMNKTLRFHLTDGSVRELIAPLAEYEGALLQRPEFIKVHRAYIVNLMQIQEMRTVDILTYSGVVVPVSRRLYAQVRKAYMDQLFVEKGVE